MENFKFSLKLFFAFIARFKSVILSASVLGVVAFVLVGLLGQGAPFESYETVGVAGRFKPTALPLSISRLISDGLTKIEDDQSVAPALAESWYTTDGGKTWFFTLRKDALWQDKKPVVSGDINYFFSGVVIEKPNDQTIVFELPSPFSPFPSLLAQPAFKKGLLGTGEWRAINIRVTGGFVKELTLENLLTKKMRFRFYPTEERAKLALKLGQVTKIENVFSTSPFENWRTLNVEEFKDRQKFIAVFFNVEDKLLSEKAIRQALSYAIDKEAFGGERVISSISPSSWGFNPSVKPYSYDLGRAKELFNSVKKDGELSITLTAPSILLDTAEAIADDWEALGLETRVSAATGVPQDYQALLVIYDIPQDPDQYALWHSSQESTNISRYKSPRINKLLEDGRIEMEQEARRKIYLDFQRFLIEDAPAAFLTHPTFYTISKK